MTLNALEGKALPIYGKGENVRDWLYVGDHVRALWLIAVRGKLGETYNVGGGAEWAFAANWSAKAEYLYYDLGSLSHLMTDPNFPSIFNAKADFTCHIARLGVNYRF